MDYQNRAGSKFGGGGVASHSATNADRRERLRKLALETIDLDKDPPSKRRLLPRPHPRQEASNEPRPSRRPRTKRRQRRGRPPNGSPRRCRRRRFRCARPGRGRRAQERGQDRPSRIQDHQSTRPHHAPARVAVPAAVPGHCDRCYPEMAGHERVQPTGGGAR
ncbi:hypothetical protein SMACR_00833 [Sordaria macrospora]|uniref:Uncharacterized protein n=1 Tax=Sordaria macrospora TaxID=5147 RepID=A0A8S9A295_SORMA|nr:hypothetical protein SMACR_00833 [Sordaria macrospora]